MKFFVFFTLSFLVLFTRAYAQSDFRSGYVVLNSGDTLVGFINYKGNESMALECVFRSSKASEKRSFKPHEIKAYRFDGDRMFLSRTVKTTWGAKEIKPVFIEWLIHGKLDLFCYRGTDGDHYLIEKEGYELVELPYGTVKGTSTINSEKTKTHLQLLRLYTKDAPQLVLRIQELSELRLKPLTKFVKLYNETVETSAFETQVYRKPKRFSVSPELVAGSVYYLNNDIQDKTYFQIGTFANIKLHTFNERLYFRTGVMISRIDLNKETGSRLTKNYATDQIYYTKIPLHLAYIGPDSHRIRPSFSYGLNFIGDLVLGTSSFTAGAKINVYKKLYFSITGEMDFRTSKIIILIPVSSYSYGLNGGFYMSF